MEINPSKELIKRALRMDWENLSGLYISKEKTIGLINSRSFFPKRYKGVLTFKKHLLVKEELYAFSLEGPAYRGKLIKDALTVLGAKRVRIFFHLPKRETDLRWLVLLLGTEEGTVAIVPIITSSSEEDTWASDEVTQIKKVVRGMSSKLLRSFVFSSLGGK